MLSDRLRPCRPYIGPVGLGHLIGLFGDLQGESAVQQGAADFIFSSSISDDSSPVHRCRSTVVQQLLPGEKIISTVATMNIAAKAMTPAIAG